ncbi:MAG: NADPH-dependent F420 reductase [Pseudomonadota bacterium]|nr:NADPH-dependent F420 reductase [Pseudomonadota bacterium]
MNKSLKIAVVGGTGQLGGALARRLKAAGHDVVVGSRSSAKTDSLPVLPNPDAAAFGDVIIVAVPFSAQEDTLRQIAPQAAGKVVIDTTVPLAPPKVMRVQMPEEGCAALRAQNLLGDACVVVSAFQNVAAHKLAEPGPVDCDVLVFSDDKDARALGVRIAGDAGLRGIEGGVLANSVSAEALTSVLIFINKTYKVDGAGIRITGELATPGR